MQLDTLPTMRMKGRVRFRIFDEDMNPDTCVIKETGEEVHSLGWVPNMILDQYFTQATDVSNPNTWYTGATGFRDWLAVGDDSTEYKRKSSTVPTTVSLSAGTATAGAAYFVAGDVGKMLVFNGTGIATRIVTFNSSTEVICTNTTDTIGAQNVEVWRTDATTLNNQVLIQSDDGGFADVDTSGIVTGVAERVVTVSRLVTMDINRTITEWGFSRTNGTLKTFADLFRDGGGAPQSLVVNAGKKVLVQHELTCTISNTVTVGHTFDIDEYDAGGGFVGTTTITCDYNTVYTFNSADVDYIFNLLSPSTGNSNILIDAADVNMAGVMANNVNIGNYDWGANAASARTAVAHLSDGTFFQNISGTLIEGDAVGSIHGVLMKYSTLPTVRGVHMADFTSPTTFTKANTHTLQLSFRRTFRPVYP